MNKRGQGIILDLIVKMVFIFLAAIFIVTAIWFHETIKDEAGSDIYPNNERGQEVLASIDTTISMFSFIFVMMLAGILVALLVSAHTIETSPVFLIVGIIIVAILVMIAAPISNSFAELTEDPEIAAQLTEHNLILSLMDKFPLINLIFGVLFLIVMYAKKRGGEGTIPLPV